MLSVSNLSLQFGKRVLFDEVNITFSPGNCYGVIGANGAGKSTFLKILSKDLEPNTGSVFLEPGKRLSVLEQNHNRYDENTVIETVILGNQKLFELKSEIDSIYAKEDFSDKDADRVGELQASFEEMNGYLKKPQSYIKGTKMAFAGLRKEKDRASVILYLNQNSDSPLPLP